MSPADCRYIDSGHRAFHRRRSHCIHLWFHPDTSPRILYKRISHLRQRRPGRTIRTGSQSLALHSCIAAHRLRGRPHTLLCHYTICRRLCIYLEHNAMMSRRGKSRYHTCIDSFHQAAARTARGHCKGARRPCTLGALSRHVERLVCLCTYRCRVCHRPHGPHKLSHR